MSKQFLAVIAAIIVVFAGIIIFTGKDDKSSSSSSNSAALSQHIEGNGSAGVTLVEYGDFQCPFCKDYYPIVKQVAAKYSDQIKFQYRNYPLTQIHQNAFAGARAAEAASKQNKYWEMHDILYEQNDRNGQQGWVASSDPTTYFNQFAQQIGLDLVKFKTDYASTAVNDTVNADMAEGNKLKITGTPTFFIDGKKVEVSQDPASFDKVIQAEIAKKAPATSSSTSSASQPAASN